MVHSFRVNFQAGGKLKWHPGRSTHRRDTYCTEGIEVERKRKTSRVFIRLLYCKKFIGSSWTDFAPLFECLRTAVCWAVRSMSFGNNGDVCFV